MPEVVKILIGSFFGSFGYAIGYSGRFKLPIKRGSMMHTVLGRINLAFHGLTVVSALALPALTSFAGGPTFAYLAAALIVTSLFLYPLQPLGLRVRIANAGGQRAKPLAEQERTRWPYASTCGIGYVVMLVYVWTIAPIYW